MDVVARIPGVDMCSASGFPGVQPWGAAEGRATSFQGGHAAHLLPSPATDWEVSPPLSRGPGQEQSEGRK